MSKAETKHSHKVLYLTVSYLPVYITIKRTMLIFYGLFSH